MALFVDLDDEVEPPQQGGKPVWNGRVDAEEEEEQDDACDREAHESEVMYVPNPNRNSMTEALGCYP